MVVSSIETGHSLGVDAGCPLCRCGTAAARSGCDADTGACACAEGAAPPNCEQCLDEYYGLTTTGCLGKFLFSFKCVISMCNKETRKIETNYFNNESPDQTEQLSRRCLYLSIMNIHCILGASISVDKMTNMRLMVFCQQIYLKQIMLTLLPKFTLVDYIFKGVTILILSSVDTDRSQDV